MTAPVSTLTGPLLARAVAMALELEPIPGQPAGFYYWKTPGNDFDSSGMFCPHEDWAHGGPFLEEHFIGFKPISDAEWLAEEYITGCTGRGPTPLIAAMRAIVAVVYGDTMPEGFQ